MAEVLDRNEVREKPVHVEAKAGTLLLEHDGRLADLYRVVGKAHYFERFFASDLSVALSRPLDQRVGGIRSEVHFPESTLEVNGKQILLKIYTATEYSLCFEQGSVKTKIGFVFGAVAAIYTGVATYPNFEAGAKLIFERVETILPDALEERYRQIFYLDVSLEDVHFTKNPDEPFVYDLSDRQNSLTEGDEIDSSDRELVMQGEKISASCSMVPSKDFVQEMKVEIDKVFDQLPEVE